MIAIVPSRGDISSDARPEDGQLVQSWRKCVGVQDVKLSGSLGTERERERERGGG